MTKRTIQDVHSALQSAGLAIEIQFFEESTATAPQAAAALNAPLGSIVKSLCFLVDGAAVLVLTAGDRKVDDRKLGALYNVGRKKVRIADADTTIAVTGYAPGGVPPIGHGSVVPVLIDSSLHRFTTVYAAAGTANSIFPIELETLKKITLGTVADVVREEDVSPQSILD